VIRLATVAVLLALAVGFGGSAASALPQGTCRIYMPGAMETRHRYSQVLDAALPDGSVVVGSSYVQRHSAIVHLRRVLPDCQIAASFRVIVRSSFTWGIDAIAATPDGRILLAGNSRRSAVVGRFFANGGLDRSFGNDGWARILGYRHPYFGNFFGFDAKSLAFGPDGTIVVGGTDGGAHCCSREFVSELTPNGALIRSFGRDGSRAILGIAGSYITDVSVNPDRSIYVFGEYEQSGCGAPTIVRLFTDGSFDSRFDTAMARTIKHVARPKLRFSPSLVPDGADGFTLVGGLDRTCVLPNGTNPSEGVSVRVASSGQMVGAPTYFYSREYAFDTPAALRLPSGRIVAAGFGGANTLVQVLGPDGSRDPNIGDHGLLRFGPPPGAHDRYPSTGLLRRAGGSAWLVSGLRHEIDLTPLPVR